MLDALGSVRASTSPSVSSTAPTLTKGEIPELELRPWCAIGGMRRARTTWGSGEEAQGGIVRARASQGHRELPGPLCARVRGRLEFEMHPPAPYAADASSEHHMHRPHLYHLWSFAYAVIDRIDKAPIDNAVLVEQGDDKRARRTTRARASRRGKGGRISCSPAAPPPRSLAAAVQSFLVFVLPLVDFAPSIFSLFDPRIFSPPYSPWYSCSRSAAVADTDHETCSRSMRDGFGTKRRPAQQSKFPIRQNLRRERARGGEVDSRIMPTTDGKV
ncbi:hypothetical protein C8R45DRAFT_1180667 [Mycena sanguinolenta]|nr:hypothetical protein C8R45DRAFT_1180667 [Mycena sanguinolenta]